MASSAARGKKALDISNYEEAITQYTTALKESPTSPDYLIQRSTAYLRAKKHVEALRDAESAVLNAQKRAKREMIVEAQFRRGCALYNLEKYGDAECCFAVVKRMKSEHKMCDMWINKTKMALAKLPVEDEKRKRTVEETPTAITEHIVEDSPVKEAAPVDSKIASVAPVAPQQTPTDKIKWDWYQNRDNVYFTLSVKGAPKDKVRVDIQKQSLNISFPLVTGADYDLSMEPLFAEVTPSACTSRVLPMKIEVTLFKATPGVKWSAMEGQPDPAIDEAKSHGATTEQEQAVKQAVLADKKPAGPPAYPTSSKTGAKNWDKITTDMQGPEEGPDAEVEGDVTNDFFKKLFKGASPDVQRAMMKSYTESNGTALSTNWAEVSKAPVETLPPDGMEAKKWS